jgi:hypothetical protein
MAGLNFRRGRDRQTGRYIRSMQMSCADFDDVQPISGQAFLAVRQCRIQHPSVRLRLLARQGNDNY